MSKSATLALFLAVAAVPAAAGDRPGTACLREVGFVERLARAEADWMKRETTLAALTEARREAERGREAACMAVVDKARSLLRS